MTIQSSLRSVAFSCLLLLVLLCLSSAVYAVPSTDVPTTLTQPDGTVLHCLVSGDEYYHRIHDSNGYVIVQDPYSGEWVYAVLDNGKISASQYAVESVDPAGVGLTPNIIPNDEEVQTFQAKSNSKPLSSMATISQFASPSGTMNLLVIFIRFSGESEFTDAKTTLDTIFNSTTTGAVSLCNYFAEESYNALNVSTTFYPTSAGSTVVSVQDSHPRAYYQPYDATLNPIGYQTAPESYARVEQCEVDAVNAIASQVPTNLNLDADGDGNVDCVVFMFSGDAEPGHELWPQQGDLSGHNVYINSKKVARNAMEFRNWVVPNNAVGVLAHEMQHVFGSPDFYHYGGGVNPMGNWEVMCGSSNSGQHSTAWVKYKYLGWLSAPTTISSGTYTLNPVGSSTNCFYKIASPNSSTEFFIVEYRRNTGAFESSIPGSGLLVYRVNTAVTGNGGGPPDEVYIYRPNGTSTNTGDLGRAFFTSDAGRTAINDYTNPACKLSDWTTNGGICIYNIGSAGPTITFTVGSGLLINSWAGIGGSISPSGNACVTSGSSKTYTITPNAGYVVSSVVVDGVNQGSISSYTFSNVTTNHTIYATFTSSSNDKVAYYKFDETSGITASDSSGNGFSAALNGTCNWVAGKYSNAISLDGSTGYVGLSSGILSSLNDFTIATWAYLNTNNYWNRLFDFGTGTSVYMFLSPNNGATGKIRYAITTSSGPGEQFIDGASALTTGAWHHVAVTLSGTTGTLYVDGVQVGQNANMTLKPSSMGITSRNYIGKSQYPDPYFRGYVDDFKIYNRALSASDVSGLYNGSTYTITASAGTGGLISPSGVVYVASSDSQTFTITANTGYAISSVVVDGVDQGAISSYTFTNVTATHTISATFVQNITDYTITASAGAGGSISPSGSVLVASGTNQAFAITPNAGYVISQVTVDGVNQGAISSYTFSNVTANHTISASFIKDQVAYYKFDSRSGITVTDSSGNGKNGTLYGGYSWVTGKYSKAVKLNGSTGYAGLPTGIMSGVNDFTISAWVKLSANNAWNRVFDFGTGTSTYMFLSPNNGATGKVRYAITTSGGAGEQIIDGSSALTTGVWHKVSVTLSGTTGTLYVDGVQVGQNINMTLKPSSLGSTNLNYIGKSQYPDPYLNGLVDDFKIYRRALSASEVSAL